MATTNGNTDVCGLCQGSVSESDKAAYIKGASDPVVRAFELKQQEVRPGTVVRIFGGPLKAVDVPKDAPAPKCEFPYDSDDEDESKSKCSSQATHVVSTLWGGENAVCEVHKQHFDVRHSKMSRSMVMVRMIGTQR
jgi:hypothetical protein